MLVWQGTAPFLIREKHELLTQFGGLHGPNKGPQSVWVCYSQLKPPNTMTSSISSTFMIITYSEASSLLTNTALPHLLPMHHHGCTMASGGIYFHIQNLLRYSIWTLSCALISEIQINEHFLRLKVMHFNHTVDNNRRCREDKQVSQSIIRSPSALSVQQPVSSRALKISLISSERTADTWNITLE